MIKKEEGFLRDHDLTDYEKDMVRRNAIVFKAISFVTALTLIAIFTMGAEMTTPQMLMVFMQLTVWGLFAVLHIKRKLVMYLSYLAVLGSAVSTSITLLLQPSALNVFSIYYLIILALIYMNKKLSILTQIYGLFMLLYMLYAQSETISIPEEDKITYIIYYLLITILILSLLQVTQHMMKQVEESRKNTESLLARQQEQKDSILQLVKDVSKNLEVVSSLSETNNHSFYEMNTTFQDIASGANAQNESTLEINNSVTSMREVAKRMLDSITKLKDETEGANYLSEQGQEQVEHLTKIITDFKGEIDTMSEEITQLITNLKETNKFSETIKEIANQTNLLSLNASIEAARAGEHGRGFSIVANEIRNLSDMTTKSANQISEQLEEFTKQSDQTRNRMIQIAEQMDKSYAVTANTKNSFKAINEAIAKLLHLADDSNRLTMKMDQTVEVINNSTEDLAAVSEQSSASLEELMATLENILKGNTAGVDSIKAVEKSLKSIQ
ncbi:methyl-accepting chemotaxis protein [Metabacillus litoralis]|uniref:methyl-accepting chemotaxis protein n=2 Tax=Metabacillus litoralis TaxID=152268 RepID=UPI00214B807D|nr:methyl-accepting chemotaxis protein [Metabacillus litoralis]